MHAGAEAVLEATPAAARQPVEESDWKIEGPGSFSYIDIPQPPQRVGPAPERSPLRVRFDSRDGAASVTLVVRGSQSVKQTFLQVTDISVYGSAEAVASLLLPRGSRLIAMGTDVEQQPPRMTKLGPVDVPPKSYYYYDFETTNGLRVFLAAAAQRGKIYACSGTAPKDRWADFGADLEDSVRTFRIKPIEVL